MSRAKGWGYNAGFGLTYVDIEPIAAAIRHILAPALKAHELFPMERVLDQLEDHSIQVGGDLYPLRFVVSEDLPFEGQTRFADGRFIVMLRTTTYELMRHGDSRALFTAAHEIAHAFVHSQLLMKLSTIPHHQAVLARAGKWHNVWEDTEWQADAVAAALLAPAHGVARLFGDQPTLGEIMQAFGIGYTSATHRLRSYSNNASLKLINPEVP